MKIWANTIINNEDKFIWFSVMSVIDFVDKVLIYDTGSTDRTREIIELIQRIKPGKVILKVVGQVDKYQFTNKRQEMLERSRCDWVLILDGDEIWWEDSIKKLVQKIKSGGEEIGGIFVPFYVPLGDLYHFQEDIAGQYKMKGRIGHFSLRAFSKHILGLHADLPYGSEGYFDNENQPIQEREKVVFLNAPYLHATHLIRSSEIRRDDKIKYELGDKVRSGFTYPEIFYKETPKDIDSPWRKMSLGFWLRSAVMTPPRKLKRRALRILGKI